MSVSPNPTKETSALLYQLKQSADVEITITDVLGKRTIVHKAMNEAAGEHNIMLGEDLSVGIYFVQITAGNKTSVIKLVKG